MTTSNTEDSLTTKNVYEAHRDKILGNQYNDPAKEPQGYCIEQMKEYAKTVIPNEDATTMNCATFDDFGTIFGIIEDESHIRYDRVYPALRHTGMMKCYSEFKHNGGDVLSDMKECLRTCKRSGKLAARQVADQQSPIFTDMHTRKYRVSKQSNEGAIDLAKSCGINTSHLNLYHALHGLKRLVENSPTYFLGDEYESIEDALRHLRKAENAISANRDMLRAWMGI